MFNALIHALMYSYYLLAALGPAFKRYLWWKQHLTSLQLVQFVVGFFRSLAVVTGVVNCGYPWQVSLLTVGVMALVFVLFAEFYARAYFAPRGSRKGRRENGGEKSE